MPDVFDSRRRSEIMASIKQKDTAPELIVRRVAHALGYRFRLHRRDLAGKPDIVFPRLKKVIFVHGCFWHRHPACRHAAMPKTRIEFWTEKFDQNVRRDAAVVERLEAAGWNCLVVWGCETRDVFELKSILAEFLGRRLPESWSTLFRQ